MNPLLFICGPEPPPPGGGDTSLQEAYADFPVDGVAFSIELLGWGRKFSDFGGKRNYKWEESRLKNITIRKLLFIKFNNILALTALHSAAWNHIDKVGA